MRLHVGSRDRAADGRASGASGVFRSPPFDSQHCRAVRTPASLQGSCALLWRETLPREIIVSVRRQGQGTYISLRLSDKDAVKTEVTWEPIQSTLNERKGNQTRSTFLGSMSY